MARLFALLQRLLPQHLLSRIVGRLANVNAVWMRVPLIKLFVAMYGVDLGEAEFSSPRDYASFNAFFTRKLKPSLRPVSGSISSPADGTVSMAGRLQGNQMLQAKGLNYSLEKLLAGDEATQFRNGSYVTIYLSPRDYHRVHIPVTANLVAARYVPGKLFSVNQATTGAIADLFAANERLVMHFSTDLGPMVVVMVGAMIVAGIKTVWRDRLYSPREADRERFEPPRHFDQGAELGLFEMGSTVIVIFQREVPWTVKPGDKVRMGEAMVDWQLDEGRGSSRL